MMSCLWDLLLGRQNNASTLEGSKASRRSLKELEIYNDIIA